MSAAPLKMSWTTESQEQDPKTKAPRESPGKYYHLRPFGDFSFLCYVPPGGDKDTSWRVVLTDKTVGPATQWFHKVGGHLWRDRLY